MTQAIALAEAPEIDLDDALAEEIIRCQRDVQDRINATNAYRNDSRERLDNILAQVLGFGQRWLAADAWHLNEAYRQRQILPTPDGGNHFLQLTYLLTGKNDPEKTVKYDGEKVPRFIKGTAFAKYAGALRLMDEEGVTPEGVPDYIESFADNHPGYGKRLNGMLALDRERNGAGSRDMFVNEAELLDQAAYSAIMANDLMDTSWKEELLAKPREFAMAWGVVVDGQFYPGGIQPNSGTKAKSAALKSVEAAS